VMVTSVPWQLDSSHRVQRHDDPRGTRPTVG
jgi:hypothetical protein